MGIYASYYAINEKQVNEYKTLLAKGDDNSVEEFFEGLEELEDDENYIDLDKLWDGLHFLLTGFASYDDEAENKTPEQIALFDGFFGEEELSDIGCLLNADKVADVVNALNKVDIDKLLKEVDFEKFAEADLYPDIWDDIDELEEICEEFQHYFEEFKQFYQNVLKNGKSVLIIIG